LVNAWIWTAEDFEFKCSDTNAIIQFGSDFDSYPVDVDRNYWTFYNITMDDGEELEYLMFSGEDCNVTLTELNKNKLYVATVADASSNSIVSLNSNYNLPYVQNVSGAITALEVYFVKNNRLIWSLTGDGSTTIKILCKGHTPYYLKINGDEKAEGEYWSVSGNTVTVTDTLGSTHDYELGFSELFSITESLFTNIYATVGLLSIIPLMISASIILLCLKGGYDSKIVLAGVISLIGYTVAVITLLVILPALQTAV